MTKSQLINLAITSSRENGGPGMGDNEALAAFLNKAYAMSPISLTDAYGVAMQNGATIEELQKANDINPAMIERLAEALAEGNLRGAQGLIAVASGVAPNLAGHLSAIVDDLSIRYIDVVAERFNYGARPQDVDAQDVADALDADPFGDIPTL